MTVDPSKFVGEIPHYYDTGLGPVLFEDYAADLAKRAASFKPSSVLELAAGTGIVSRKLRDALPPKTRLVVTDLNPPMLEIARKKFKDGENVDFIPADAMNLDFADKTFDLIVCQFGVMFFPDKRAAFREALRVLRTGGTYLLNAWGTLDENQFAKLSVELSDEFFPKDPPQFYKTPFSYSDPATVQRDMKAGGLKKVRYEALAIEKDVASWEEFARGIVYGNALIDEIRNRGGVSPEDFMNAVARKLREKFGPEPGPMPLKANIFWGKRGGLFSF